MDLGDPAWTPVGIEFSDDGPQTWYPGRNRRHVAIQLSTGARDDPDRAIWQVAQEIPHLLGPTGRPASATMLEEGMAVSFAETIAKQYGLKRFAGYSWSEPYRSAAELVGELFAVTDHDVVRRLRARQLCIPAIDATLICELCPTVSAEWATALCQRFMDPGK